MKRFEYCVLSAVAALERFGTPGWDLVAVTAENGWGEATYYFKREICHGADESAVSDTRRPGQAQVC